MKRNAVPMTKRGLLELTIAGREKALAALPPRSKNAKAVEAELRDLRARLDQTPAPGEAAGS